jgi:hypothetical protein
MFATLTPAAESVHALNDVRTAPFASDFERLLVDQDVLTPEISEHLPSHRQRLMCREGRGGKEGNASVGQRRPRTENAKMCGEIGSP